MASTPKSRRKPNNICKLKVKENITWIAIAKAIAIISVISVHAQFLNHSTGESFAFCSTIKDLMTPWDMALFFSLSGGLLYTTRIKRKISVGKLYKDKIVRTLVPFAFFVVVYFCVKIFVGQGAKTPVHASCDLFVRSFFFYEGMPSAFLWFLPTLFDLMLLHPLYVFVCKQKWLECGFLLLSLILYFLDLECFWQYGAFGWCYVSRYLVYFFLGIVAFKNNLCRHLDNVIALLISAAILTVGIWFQVPLLHGLGGVATALSISMLIAHRFSAIFSSFRDYIFQIYLLSMFFQGVVELVLWRRFYNENLIIPFFLLNVLSGIYGPVFVTKIVKRIPFKAFRLCFGMK